MAVFPPPPLCNACVEKLPLILELEIRLFKDLLKIDYVTCVYFFVENNISDSTPGYIFNHFSNQYTGHTPRFSDLEIGILLEEPFCLEELTLIRAPHLKICISLLWRVWGDTTMCPTLK